MTLAIAGNSSSGYTITKSLRFRRSASAYLNRTPATTGTGAGKLFTASMWVKRGAFTTSSSYQELMTGKISSTSYGYFGFDANDKFVFNQSNSGSFQALTTTQVFRDPAAWYHIVVVYDSANATAANRAKIYVNGSQVTAFDTATYPPQNSICGIMYNNATYINTFDGASEWFDGYLAEVNFIDGQALTPANFGNTNPATGVWQPIKYAGTYGTNGFYLPFTNTTSTTTLGNDFSGNGNNWTTNNISLTSGATYDSMNDVPTLTSATQANYCVMNPTSSGATLSNGNLRAVITSANSCIGTMAVTSGKVYCECTINSVGAGMWFAAVLSTVNLAPSNSGAWGTSSSLSYRQDGTKAGPTTGAYGAAWTTGDVLSMALDLDSGTCTFYKNGVSQGIAFNSGVSGRSWYPVMFTDTASATVTWNFGQTPFTYTLPTGYTGWNTYNLPNSTIPAGNKVMDATTYTGNGTTQSVVNAGGFKPDFVWVKNRTTAPSAHRLVDSVRGATKEMYSNATDAEATDVNGLTSFNSNGFTVGSTGAYNLNGNAIVGWQWQAGQGTTSTNTNGSITSTVSVNATAGFSIVKYTGTGSAATVGHGLGVAPSMMIIKSLGVEDWFVYHSSLGGSPPGYVKLNSTAANGGGSSAIFPSAPTSTVINEGGGTGVGANGVQHIAYCWTPIAGFSQFGSYTGNASTDGPFIYLGFRPKWLLIKVSSGTTNNWLLEDTSRTNRNVMGAYLFPNLSDAEGTNVYADFLSNGFKIRDNGPSYNGSGYTYIYAAFAENPFKNALAR